jgi:hypothetical protein
VSNSDPALSNPGRLTGGPVSIGQVPPKTKASRQLLPRAVTVPHPNDSDRLAMPQSIHDPMRRLRCLLLLDHATPRGQQLASFCARLPVPDDPGQSTAWPLQPSANRATVARNLLSLGLQSLEAIASS